MSASAFHVTRTSTGIRVWFTVLNANRTLRTGLVAGNFTVTLIRDDDGAVNNPAVTESAQLSGVYYFDVPSAFLTTNGNNYFMVIQVTLAPVDVVSAPLFVSQQLWDQLETEADASSRATTNQTEHDATQATLAALNDLAIADVQTAMTNQGYTAARAPNLDNLDAAVSTRAIPGDAMTLTAGERTAVANEVDSVLTTSHGAGSWQTSGLTAAAVATQVWSEALPGVFGAGTAGFIVGTNLDVVVSTRSSHSAADVDTTLSGTHGAGSWATATGFATPGDAMTLTGAAETSLLGVFDAAHGVGSWVGAGLTAAQDAALTYIWTHVGGNPLDKMTHTRATIGTPGVAQSDSNLVNQVVTQVDANTATFEQQ